MQAGARRHKTWHRGTTTAWPHDWSKHCQQQLALPYSCFPKIHSPKLYNHTFSVGGTLYGINLINRKFRYPWHLFKGEWYSHRIRLNVKCSYHGVSPTVKHTIPSCWVVRKTVIIRNRLSHPNELHNDFVVCLYSGVQLPSKMFPRSA